MPLKRTLKYGIFLPQWQDAGKMLSIFFCFTWLVALTVLNNLIFFAGISVATTPQQYS